MKNCSGSSEKTRLLLFGMEPGFILTGEIITGQPQHYFAACTSCAAQHRAACSSHHLTQSA